ncbi:bZIP transcription factor 16-like isoform X2 [Amaranthus tricolor]|uniref:bZIP transcription factor 16-like isoform X2 n=1 Tax=Amaranthus tricolor TaxID=29722 RepID=UPI002585CB79|nr:bZIP transcription factor 16-like isoform X2 [Amaranthus tricolor]
MGSSKTDKPAKDQKTPVEIASHEQSSDTSTATATVNADWGGFQAYSPIPPPGFMASSPQAHPYMWGVQPIMPPYGTPPHPYVAMYPHGGIYAHPSIHPGSYPFSPYPMPPANGMAEASGTTHVNADGDGKHPEGKEKLPIKRSKGSLGSLNMITGKTNEEGKATGAVANGICSKRDCSAESASNGSSEGSDASSQNDSGGKQEAHEDGSQSGNPAHVTQNGVLNVPHSMVNHAMAMVPMTAPGAPAAVPGPATNLNIGMDYWGTPASSTIPAMRGKAPSAPGIVPTGSRDQSPLWLQDERELKRQRRKQSNRESARRSRLRKQAECDELAQRAEALKEENSNLRSELNRIRSDYEQLMAENTALKERIGEIPEGIVSSRAELSMAGETQESGKTDN